jgi:hypothetical protein
MTNRDAISTVGTPRPNVARWRASAAIATAAPIPPDQDGGGDAVAEAVHPVGLSIEYLVERLHVEPRGAVHRRLVECLAGTGPQPVLVRPALGDGVVVIGAAGDRAGDGDADIGVAPLRGQRAVQTGSSSVCARRYVVPMAFASWATSARRDS